MSGKADRMSIFPQLEGKAGDVFYQSSIAGLTQGKFFSRQKPISPDTQTLCSTLLSSASDVCFRNGYIFSVSS